eukprot:SAG11_NODE_11960_length_729_cov_0.830159_1_plen_114_part_00
MEVEVPGTVHHHCQMVSSIRVWALTVGSMGSALVGYVNVRMGGVVISVKLLQLFVALRGAAPTDTALHAARAAALARKKEMAFRVRAMMGNLAIVLPITFALLLASRVILGVD